MEERQSCWPAGDDRQCAEELDRQCPQYDDMTFVLVKVNAEPGSTVQAA
jgi:hypothetical protein